jgi:nucleoside-diphosphate-sugar epimerase
MRATLLTGYGGLLGRAVLSRLVDTDHVFCLGRTAPPAHPRIEHIEADLATGSFVPRLPASAQRVIHLAQADGYDAFPEQADQVFAVNVASVSHLLSWARRAGVRQFVHASTGGLYGTGPQPFAETDEVRIGGRLAHYAATKRSAELLADAFRPFFHVSALRYFFIYGRGQRGHMLMPRLVASVREGRPITLAGADGIRVNPIHVDDAAGLTLAAAALDRSELFNIGGSEVLSLREVGELIGKALGTSARFTVDQVAVPGHVVGDVQKMTTQLGAARIRFADGIRDMC